MYSWNVRKNPEFEVELSCTLTNQGLSGFSRAIQMMTLAKWTIAATCGVHALVREFSKLRISELRGGQYHTWTSV